MDAPLLSAELSLRPALDVPSRAIVQTHTKGRSVGLDLARALAILLVCIAHFGGPLAPDTSSVSAALIYAGNAGVELFFSLSGFLIGRILIRLAQDGLHAGGIGNFWARRWLRTLPLYYVTLIMVSWWLGLWDIRSFLFLQNFGFESHPQPLIVSWSLVLEEYFYFSFPLLMLALARLGRGRYAGLRGVTLIAAGLAVGCGLARIGLNLAGLGGADPSFRLNPLLRLDCAAYGVLAACLLQARSRWFAPLYRPPIRRMVFVGVGLFAFLDLMLFLFVVLDAANAARLHYAAWSTLYVPMHNTMLNGAFALLVLALAHGNDRLPRSFALPAEWLSRLSYSIYLVHVPVLFFMVPALMPRLGVEERVAAGIVATLAVSFATYQLIERPFLALRDRWFRLRGPSPDLHDRMVRLLALLGSSRFMRAGLVLSFALFVAARVPAAFLTGRFWAEEGVVYYANALTQPWWAALTAVHTGYINLVAGLATLIAADTASLENAPRIATLIALAVQVLPAVLLATGRLSWLRSNWMLAVAFLILATPPGADEVAVNSITSQFHLMLAAALVLVFEPRRDGMRWVYFGVLLAAPLTGPGSVMIAPLFALRAVVERSWPRAQQALIVIAAAMIQLAIIGTHPEPARNYQAGLGMLASIMYVKHILNPLFGVHADAMAQAVQQSVERGHWPLRALIAVPVVFGALCTAAWVSRYRELKWAVSAGLVFALLSYFGAVASAPTDLLYRLFGNRYSFAPAVLFGLVVLALATDPRRLIRYPALAMIAWLVIVGLSSYVSVDPFGAGPNWRHEVAAWRHDPKHLPQVWPGGAPWTLSLPVPLQP